MPHVIEVTQNVMRQQDTAAVQSVAYWWRCSVYDSISHSAGLFFKKIGAGTRYRIQKFGVENLFSTQFCFAFSLKSWIYYPPFINNLTFN